MKKRRPLFVRFLVACVVCLMLVIISIVALALVGPTLGGPLLNPGPVSMFQGDAVVWLDNDADGKQGPNEVPLANVKINYLELALEDQLLGTGLSNSDGMVDISFLFDCDPHNLRIFVEIPDGYVATTPVRYNVVGETHGGPKLQGGTYYFGLKQK